MLRARVADCCQCTRRTISFIIRSELSVKSYICYYKLHPPLIVDSMCIMLLNHLIMRFEHYKRHNLIMWGGL